MTTNIEITSEESTEESIESSTHAYINFNRNINAITLNFLKIRSILEKDIQLLKKKLETIHDLDEAFKYQEEARSLELRFRTTKEQLIIMVFSHLEWYLNNMIYMILYNYPDKLHFEEDTEPNVTTL